MTTDPPKRPMPRHKPGIPRLNRQTSEMRAELWFQLYYGMGTERTLPKVREYGILLGLEQIPSMKTLRNWSATQGWQDRVSAMNQRLIEHSEVQTLGMLDELNNRHAVLGRAIQNVGARVIQAFGQDTKIAEVSFDEAARALERGAKLERLARGAATERSEILVSVWSTVVEEVAMLFLQVNALGDAEVRKAEFAHGFDEIAQRHVGRELSAAR